MSKVVRLVPHSTLDRDYLLYMVGKFLLVQNVLKLEKLFVNAGNLEAKGKVSLYSIKNKVILQAKSLCQ